MMTTSSYDETEKAWYWEYTVDGSSYKLYMDVGKLSVFIFYVFKLHRRLNQILVVLLQVFSHLLMGYVLVKQVQFLIRSSFFYLILYLFFNLLHVFFHLYLRYARQQLQKQQCYLFLLLKLNLSVINHLLQILINKLFLSIHYQYYGIIKTFSM